MIVAIIQARLGSQRFPRKVLADIAGEPMLAHVCHRASLMETVDRVVVATDEASHGDLYRADVVWPGDLYMGPAEPLARYVDVVERLKLRDDDYVVRLTGDCPGLDPKVSDATVKWALQHPEIPYMANLRDWPDGLDTEVFKVWVLREAHARTGGAKREHVTPWMRKLLWCGELPGPQRRDLKWSVDTPAELERVRAMYAALGPEWGWEAGVEYLDRWERWE